MIRDSVVSRRHAQARHCPAKEAREHHDIFSRRRFIAWLDQTVDVDACNGREHSADQMRVNVHALIVQVCEAGERARVGI